MKKIIFILTVFIPFFCAAQTDTIQAFSIDANTPFFYTVTGFDSEMYFSATTKSGSLDITESYISVYDSSGLLISAIPNPSKLILDILTQTVSDESEQLSLLQRKILFYETYFGKLEIGPDCDTFTPNYKPIKTCKQ